MGSALASAFLRAGHRVTVWNRSAARTAPLVAQGRSPPQPRPRPSAAHPWWSPACSTTRR
ncbi:NAD(P)-binding domain-containing protein [Lentzea guizhouensis]|uniref:NAD(P)-binding domain-containing protein n=1 Tax=Lentzea guizhouensis TaxID=1586287 RepID=UPI003AAADD5A